MTYIANDVKIKNFPQQDADLLKSKPLVQVWPYMIRTVKGALLYINNLTIKKLYKQDGTQLLL